MYGSGMINIIIITELDLTKLVSAIITLDRTAAPRKKFDFIRLLWRKVFFTRYITNGTNYQVMSRICLSIFGPCPNILCFGWFFKRIILCRFCQKLFLPDFLSNQHGIWTPYSQSIVRYSAITFQSHTACSSGFIQDFLDHYTLERRKAFSAYLWSEQKLHYAALQMQKTVSAQVSRYCILACAAVGP